MEDGGHSPFVFDRGMVYDGRPLVAALLYLSGRWRDLPDYAKVSGAGYFIKREPAKQAMAHLRYLAQQHSYPVVAAVLNAMYPPACPPVVRLVPISVPRKHLLIALPLRSDQDSAWLGRPRPYGSDKRAGRALVAEIAKRGWDRDLCLSKHRYTLGFSHRPATRNGEGRSQTFPLFVPAASAGEEERALSWDTLAGATDPGVEGKPDFHALLVSDTPPLFPLPPEASDEEEDDDNGSKDGGTHPSPSHTAALQPFSQVSQSQGQETTAMTTRTRRRGRPRTTRAEGPSSPFPAFPAPLAHPPVWAGLSEEEEEEEEDDGDNGYASSTPSPASLPLKKRPRTAATAPPAPSSSAGTTAAVNPPAAVVRQPSAEEAAVVVVKGTGAQGKGKKGGGKGKGAEAGADATARSSGTSTAFLKQLMSASLFNALWSHLSDRETFRGLSVTENTVTTYLCGIRVFLDLPGVVALPPHKLTSKAELRKYILRSGDGLFTQWAQKGFKTKSAVNQLLEFAGLFQTHHAKPSAADAGPTHAGQSKLCVYSDEAKQAAHLLATFWLPTSHSSSSTTTTIPRPITAPPPASASASSAGPVNKKTKKGAGGVGTKRRGTDTERLDALAFVAAMVSPLPTKKQRKLARGLGPYAQSDYSSSSDGDDEEDRGLWGEGGGGTKGAVVALAAAAGGNTMTGM